MALSDNELVALGEVERELLADQSLDWLFAIGFPASLDDPRRPGPARWMRCPRHRHRHR